MPGASMLGLKFPASSCATPTLAVKKASISEIPRKTFDLEPVKNLAN